MLDTSTLDGFTPASLVTVTVTVPPSATEAGLTAIVNAWQAASAGCCHAIVVPAMTAAATATLQIRLIVPPQCRASEAARQPAIGYGGGCRGVHHPILSASAA